jgi:hypothetical protein
MQRIKLKPGKFNLSGKTEEQLNAEIEAGLQALKEKQEQEEKNS